MKRRQHQIKGCVFFHDINSGIPSPVTFKIGAQALNICPVSFLPSLASRLLHYLMVNVIKEEWSFFDMKDNSPKQDLQKDGGCMKRERGGRKGWRPVKRQTSGVDPRIQPGFWWQGRIATWVYDQLLLPWPGSGRALFLIEHIFSRAWPCLGLAFELNFGPILCSWDSTGTS